MKKIIFCTGFLLLNLTGFSQEKNKTQTDTLRSINELKLTTLQLMIYRLSIEYEHMFRQNASYGVGVLLQPPQQGDIHNFRAYNYTYGAYSFFRYYFMSGKDRRIQGLFMELFLGVYGGGNITDADIGDTRDATPAIGFSVGYKWVHKTGLLLQIQLGIGKTAIGYGVFNGGIYLGYRFRGKKKIPKS